MSLDGLHIDPPVNDGRIRFGIRAILVHAISEDAKLFYERCGFRASPPDPMTLTVTVADAAKSLGAER